MVIPDDDEEIFDDGEPDPCDHQSYETDILTCQATCDMCGHRWTLTAEQLERDVKLAEEYAELEARWAKDAEAEIA